MHKNGDFWRNLTQKMQGTRTMAAGNEILIVELKQDIKNVEVTFRLYRRHVRDGWHNFVVEAYPRPKVERAGPKWGQRQQHRNRWHLGWNGARFAQGSDFNDLSDRLPAVHEWATEAVMAHVPQVEPAMT
jgi:hypothetical protein